MYEQSSNDMAMGYIMGKDNNNGYNNGFGFGGDWIWAIILLALLGNGGWGFGGGGNGGFMNYEIGRLATTNDVAMGFNNSAVLSSLNDIKLGQAQAINYNNQGFAGLNTALLQGFHNVDNAICTLGYQNQQGFNGIANQIASCCCDVKTELMQNRFLNEKQTCDLIVNQNANTQRIIDFMTSEKIAGLQAENAGLKAQISNDKQSAYLLNELKPCPIPAYLTCNPNAPYGLGYGVGFGNNCGCGCGSNSFGF